MRLHTLFSILVALAYLLKLTDDEYHGMASRNRQTSWTAVRNDFVGDSFMMKRQYSSNDHVRKFLLSLIDHAENQVKPIYFAAKWDDHVQPFWTRLENRARGERTAAGSDLSDAVSSLSDQDRDRIRDLLRQIENTVVRGRHGQELFIAVPVPRSFQLPPPYEERFERVHPVDDEILPVAPVEQPTANVYEVGGDVVQPEESEIDEENVVNTEHNQPTEDVTEVDGDNVENEEELEPEDNWLNNGTNLNNGETSRETDQQGRTGAIFNNGTDLINGETGGRDQQGRTGGAVVSNQANFQNSVFSGCTLTNVGVNSHIDCDDKNKKEDKKEEEKSKKEINVGWMSQAMGWLTALFTSKKKKDDDKDDDKSRQSQ